MMREQRTDRATGQEGSGAGRSAAWTDVGGGGGGGGGAPPPPPPPPPPHGGESHAATRCDRRLK